MQKLNEKKILGTVPKNYQMLENFWDCPEFSKEKQKGITLIALIITIIVMLILVGVTINVALNGGLFSKAEQATKGTEEKAILEEMLAMMVIDDNGKFKPDEIIANMIAKHPEYEIIYNKPNATIKGKLGTYNYIVSETEIKIGTEEDNSEGYTFTLNELGEWTGDGDSGINFSISKVWEVIGEDLSLNSEYCIGGNVFAIGSKNADFGNGYDIMTGASKIEPDMKFMVAAMIEDSNTLRFAVMGTTVTEILKENPNVEEGQMSFDEFFRLYGNTEFEIVKPTPITAKVYVNPNEEYCYIFYSNGVLQARNNSTNAVMYEIDYKIEEEAKELTINGETKTYKNRIYAENALANNGNMRFGGYFSDDGTQFISLLDLTENEDGSYTGDWETCTLDPDIEI